SHANYFFATSQPSPLLHTWTLAIEEQFYIVWPLVVFAILRKPSASLSDRSRRIRLQALLAISIAGAGISALAMAAMSHPGGDPTRVYYGTDTRAQSLLAGAALATAFTLWQPLKTSDRWRKGLGVAGILGAVGTALLWTRVNEGSILAFKGGFLLAALSACAVIACASMSTTHPISRFLSLSPLTYLGRISYGIYLWYWPTLLVVNHSETGLNGYPLVLARIAVVVAIATVSYYLVEMRIRKGALSAWRAFVALPAGVAIALISIFVSTALVAPASGASVVLGKVQGTSNGVDPPLANNQSNAAQNSTLPSSRSIKVLLVGDSMAGSLGVGMQAQQGRFGIQIVNEGSPGCSIAMDGPFKVLWYTTAPGTPCVQYNPSALLETWSRWIASYNPDVVIYFARADLMDQSINGKWENIGQAVFDRYLTARLESAAATLTSKGAKLILLTSPVYDSGEQPNGNPWPEDLPNRVSSYNAILGKVAGMSPSTISIIDTGAILSPRGQYASSVDGIITRCTDGVHLTASGGELLAQKILPLAKSIGNLHALASPNGTWPHYQAAPPAWYSKLDCP
ncbi:MAG TPA: acyltransferase family protein, partial [Acidimicrobiales bacterium]|nr:acyltransferase family protein [Acidimicrobiales bacterium]